MLFHLLLVSRESHGKQTFLINNKKTNRPAVKPATEISNLTDDSRRAPGRRQHLSLLNIFFLAKAYSCIQPNKIKRYCYRYFVILFNSFHLESAKHDYSHTAEFHQGRQRHLKILFSFLSTVSIIILSRTLNHKFLIKILCMCAYKPYGLSFV